MKRAFTIAVLISGTALFLFSCGSKSKEKLIVGKWGYDAMTPSSTTSAEDAKKMDEHSKNHMIEFDANGKYVSMKNPTDTDETGVYQLIKDGESLLTRTNGASRWDTLKIIDLTGSSFKVQTPDKDIIILKKVQ